MVLASDPALIHHIAVSVQCSCRWLPSPESMWRMKLQLVFSIILAELFVGTAASVDVQFSLASYG